MINYRTDEVVIRKMSHCHHKNKIYTTSSIKDGHINKYKLKALRPRQNSSYFADDIILLNEFFVLFFQILSICGPFPGNISADKIMAWRRRSDKSFSEAMGFFVNLGLRMRPECRKRFPCHWLHMEPLVNDPGMHHGTCVTPVRAVMHVGIVNLRWRGNVLSIPGACATRSLI